MVDNNQTQLSAEKDLVNAKIKLAKRLKKDKDEPTTKVKELVSTVRFYENELENQVLFPNEQLPTSCLRKSKQQNQWSCYLTTFM